MPKSTPRSTMGQQPTRYDRKARADARKAMKAAVNVHKIRNSEPYDGVLGMPPSWMPDPLIQEFRSHRNALLDKGHSADDVQRWRHARAAEYEPGQFWTGYWPLEFRHELDGLNYIEHIATLGEKKGIAAYLGKSAQSVYRGSVISERQRKVAKNPRADELSKCINDILKRSPQATEKEVLRALDDFDCVSVGDEVIEWSRRDGTIESTRISALKDRVSRAKRKRNSR